MRPETEPVPARYRDRKLHIHNPNVTLMRTTADECHRIGEFLVDKLNRMQGPVRFLIPQGGVSLIDAPGKPFWDPAADKVLFDVLTSGFRAGTDRKLVVLPSPENRQHWVVTVRRVVEAMKLVDDAGDSFDASNSSAGPVLAFGMGYGEHGESREEKGMGLLSGHQEEVTWGLMLQREILSDDVVFAELVSLARVQPAP